MADMGPGVGGSEPRFEYGKPLSDEEVLQYFWNSLRASQSWFTDIKDDANRLYDMYFGKTLTKADEAYLTETWRSPISFPFATGTIDAIVGADQADRKQVAFRGAQGDYRSECIAEWMTDVVRKAMDRCYGQRVESDAYLDMLISGYGCSEGYLDTTKDPIRGTLKRVQLWEIWPDPDATEDNLTDSTFVIRERPWMIEEVQARWPDKADEITRAFQVAVTSTPTLGIAGKWSSLQYTTKKDRVRIYHLQFKRYVPRVVYWDPALQKRVESAPADLEDRRQELDSQTDPTTGVPLYDPIEEHSYAAEVFYDAHIATAANAKEGGILLDFQELSVKGLTYNLITGRKRKQITDQRVRFFGPMSTLHDAQMYINKSARVYLEILERGAKGGGFVGKSAVIGSTEDFIKDRSKPGIWTVVEDEAMTQSLIKENAVQPTPTGWESFLQFCIEMISAVTGVTDWWKGTATQDRANVFVSNMQERNTIMLNPVIEPLTAFRMQNGVLLASIILKHIPTAELDKMLGTVDLIEGITGQQAPPPQPDPTTGQAPEPQMDEYGNPQLVPMLDPRTGQPITPASILKQIDPMAFDVVVDVTEASPTQKQQVWAMFQSGFLDQLSKIIPLDILAPLVMKYMPMPPEMAKQLQADLVDRMEQQKDQQTDAGMAKALKGMDPDRVKGILQQAGLNQPQKPPIQQVNFKDLPAEGKVQMAAEVGIQLDPASVAAQQQPQQPPQPGAQAPSLPVS